MAQDCEAAGSKSKGYLTSAAQMWPTSRQEDAESCGNHPGATDSLTGALAQWKTPHGMSGHDKSGKVAGGGGEFAKQALSWQTPATDSFRSRGGDRVDEPGLDQQARQWPTPKALTGGANSQRLKRRRNGKGGPGGTDLQESAEQWPTPQSRDFRSTVTGDIAKQNSRPLSEAVGHFPQDQTTYQGGKSCLPYARRLNPLFVEALMGLPLGWTDCGHSALASFRSWLRTHTALLDALSTNAQDVPIAA
jgi:DNA (cytosine-5)-methyltransferase 1